MEVLHSRPDILDVIENVARTQGLQQHKIIDVQTNQKGEGFLGDIFMVKVKDEQVDKELNLILKSAFKEDLVREFAPIRMTFENEIYFYSRIYQTFLNFAKTQGIPNPVQLVPKCYDVSLVEECELLVMENLKTQGYECFEKTLQLDHDHVKLIFEAYGRYHGYSYAYKDQYPEEFDKLAGKTQNVFKKMMENPAFHDSLIKTVDITRELLVPGKDDDILKKFEKYNAENVLQTFHDAGTINCDHAVITHGDCWSNNMLFKYKETDKGRKPIDIRLIDWQLVKLGSPVCDLSYFLYSGASKEVLDKLDYYLKIYHDTLSSTIKELGSNPEKLFPFSALKQHWKTYAKYGIILSTLVIKMKLTKKEDILDMKDIEKSDLDSKDNKRFMEIPYDKELFEIRMRDLLQHTTEIDAL